MDRWEIYDRLVSMGPVKSVDELIDRIEAEQMPIYQMRFFINEDRKEPRCFGLYHDDGLDRWIVYKNKADGSRAIRLQTPDEAQAAQEIWEKILSEIRLRLEQGKGPWTQETARVAVPTAQPSSGRRKTARSTGHIWLFIIILLFILLSAARSNSSGGSGYFGGGYYSGWDWDDDDGGWSWDDDDDDWDSGWDSWDSGDTDWDSDW